MQQGPEDGIVTPVHFHQMQEGTLLNVPHDDVQLGASTKVKFEPAFPPERCWWLAIIRRRGCGKVREVCSNPGMCVPIAVRVYRFR
jgi:hypothetical protein